MPPVPGRGGPKQSIPFLWQCPKKNGFQICPILQGLHTSLKKGFWIGLMISVGVSPQMQLQVDHVGWAGSVDRGWNPPIFRTQTYKSKASWVLNPHQPLCLTHIRHEDKPTLHFLTLYIYIHHAYL